MKNALMTRSSAVLQVVVTPLLSAGALVRTAEAISFNDLLLCPESSNDTAYALEEDKRNEIYKNSTPIAQVPCIMWDVGPAANSTDEVVITVVQVTPALCPDHRDGAPAAAQLLNQENDGLGTSIGYYDDHYVKFQLISVVAFSPEQHTEILTDMVEAIKPQYIIGTCSPAATLEREIAEKYQTMLVAQVGPPEFYKNGGSNTYLFGFHLSSEKYTKAAMQALCFHAITDILGGPPAQPVRILHRNEGDLFLSTCRAALSFAVDFDLFDVAMYGFDPIGSPYSDPFLNITKEQISNMNETADAACPPGSGSGYRPAIFVCSRTPEHDLLLDRWRENGCHPIAIWTMASNQQWAHQNLDTVPYFQGAGQWHPSFIYSDKHFSSGIEFLDSQEDALGYRGSYDMIVSYSIMSLFAKHLQWSYRTANTPTVEEDFGSVIGYEKLRRDLLVLKAQTLFGPFSLQVGQQQNSGREVAGTQWLPSSQNEIENRCTSPLSQAETTVVLPAPSALKCEAGSAVSLSRVQNEASMLSPKCQLCPVDTYSNARGDTTSCEPCPFGTNTNSELGAITCVSTDDNILSRPLVSMAFVFVCIVWSLAISMLSWILRHRAADIVKTYRNYLLTMLTGALFSSTFIAMISLHAGAESSGQLATIGCQIAPFLYCLGWVLMLGSVAG
jgi:hypothetical protein